MNRVIRLDEKTAIAVHRALVFYEQHAPVDTALMEANLSAQEHLRAAFDETEERRQRRQPKTRRQRFIDALCVLAAIAMLFAGTVQF